MELSTAAGPRKSGFRPLLLAALRWSTFRELPAVVTANVPRLNLRQEVVDARDARKDPCGVLLS